MSIDHSLRIGDRGNEQKGAVRSFGAFAQASLVRTDGHVAGAGILGLCCSWR